MKNKIIGIVGGNGAMGKWFANFFRKQGYNEASKHLEDFPKKALKETNFLLGNLNKY
jgi:prephenate dehydrogenase